MRTYISLFSSAGVGCYGFKENGFECIATSELIKSRIDIQKYNKIIDDKIKKYVFCNTILIRNIMNNKYAIVLENAFVISYEYENEIYKVKNIGIGVSLKNEILRNFKYMLKLKENDINLFSHSKVLDNQHMFI